MRTAADRRPSAATLAIGLAVPSNRTPSAALTAAPTANCEAPISDDGGAGRARKRRKRGGGGVRG